jgi:hypothetical protein
MGLGSKRAELEDLVDAKAQGQIDNKEKYSRQDHHDHDHD